MLEEVSEAEPTCIPHAKLYTLVQSLVPPEEGPFILIAQRCHVGQQQTCSGVGIFWGDGSTPVRPEAPFLAFAQFVGR